MHFFLLRYCSSSWNLMKFFCIMLKNNLNANLDYFEWCNHWYSLNKNNYIFHNFFYSVIFNIHLKIYIFKYTFLSQYKYLRNYSYFISVFLIAVTNSTIPLVALGFFFTWFLFFFFFCCSTKRLKYKLKGEIFFRYS